MKFTLPPPMSEKRRILARSHNNRVMILLVLILGYIFTAVALTVVGLSPRAMLHFVLLIGCVFGVAGIVYLIRLSKRQSVALGFVCPLCGGPLYDGRDNRLGHRGECPCCKQFIMDRL
jgi:hypothetical protein